MAFQWQYATPLSGLSFPMVTASGTYAQGYDPAQLSGVISKDGGAWAALGSRISGIPGDGVYTIASLSSTEMTAYTWIIKITANSGCLDQGILGFNLSGFTKYTDISGFAHSLDCSGLNNINSQLAPIQTAVSGVRPGVLTDLSSVTFALELELETDPALLHPINISGFAHATDCSGINGTLTAVSGLKNDVSGLPGVLIATSAIPGAIGGFSISDTDALTSGTIAHTMRLLRWFSWENLVIDKRYTPNRLYLKTDATNTSSYWTLTDDANTTNRTRGG